jgi:DNA-binding transcriptional ArsR family regulator
MSTLAIDDLSDLLKALADPTRRAVFERLCREGEVTVMHLTEGAGVSQPAISQHLATLRRVGLVHERREGRNIHYSADPRRLAQLVEWACAQDADWREHFAPLAARIDLANDPAAPG